MKNNRFSPIIRCLLCIFLSGGFAARAIAVQTPVELGSAENFSVLAGATVTNTGVGTAGQGDLGVWPGTAITGFPPGILNGTFHAGDLVAMAAQGDLTVAYDDAAGRTIPDEIFSTPDIGGRTLPPGLYKTGAIDSVGITGVLTLDAQGDPNAVWVFQIATTLITASNSQIILIGGAQAPNIFWQVGSSATLGSASMFKGTILALTSITLNIGARLDGNALARNGAVTLDNNIINGGDPLAVELESFKATAGGKFQPVFVEWVTSAELDNLGFNLFRAERSEDSAASPAAAVWTLGSEPLNATLMPGLGSPVRGARYTFRDSKWTMGQQRAYFLIDIDFSGRETLHGPAFVQIADPSQTDSSQLDLPVDNASEDRKIPRGLIRP
jgi:hypothetical protein